MIRRAGWNTLKQRIAGVAWVLCAALGLLLVPNDAEAQPVRAFSTRYAANINGDIAQIGNTVMRCNANNTQDGTSCANGQAGIGGDVNNNSFALVYVDVDGDAFGPTFNSSSADLTALPPGAVVKFAGLYWGGVSASAARNQMLLKLPGAGGYTTITASQLDTSNINVANNYAAFADVTALVAGASGGNGTYFGANIQSTEAANRWGGWALIIVYESNAKALRNLVVFDGYVNIFNTGAQVISLSGFLTPFNGPVNTQVGSFGFDGDKSSTTFSAVGDSLQVRSGTNPYTTVTDALNPPDNFFNSSMGDGGVAVTSRNPSYSFNFGVDLDRFTLPAGIIGNAATNADLNLFTNPVNGEQYLQVVVTWATDLYVPIIAQNLVKTVTDLNGGNIEPGDILRWTITMSNTGYDTGTNLVLVDPIPSTVTYVPNSLVINSAPAGGALGGMTDAISSDQADFRTGPNRVVFRLGTGAGAGNSLNDQANGGNLAFTQSTTIQFDTTVNTVAAGTVISNSATIYYSGQTLSGTNFSSASSATSATVLGGPTIAKTFTPAFIPAGGTSQLKITIANPAANPGNLNGVRFTDPFPSGMTVSASPAVGNSCTAGSTPGVITGGAATNNFIGLSTGATIVPGGSCDITVNVTATPGGVYVNTINSVTATNVSSAGAGVSATLTAGKLSISKSFTPSTIRAGQAASLSVTITNPTAAAVTGVSFIDPFPANLVIAATPGPNPSPPCGVGSTVLSNTGAALAAGAVGISMANGGIAANSSCTFAVNVTGLTATTFGVFNNTTGGVTHSADVTAGNPSNTATLTIVGAPVLTKTISPTSLNREDTATLTLTLSNPNTTTTITRAGAAFLDTYPANLINLNATSGGAIVTNNCVGGSTAIAGGVASGGTLGMSNVSLNPGGSCTLTSLVKVNPAHALGVATNGTTVVTFDNAPQGTHATASYTVTALLEPVVTKSFSSTAVSAGSAVTLTITLVNPSTAAASATTNLTGVAFTDTFPLGMVNTTGTAVIAGAGCSGGTATVTAGTLSLTGLTVQSSNVALANRSCTVTTTVSASAPGVYFNTTGTVTSANAPPQTLPGTATLNTYRGLDVVKSFVPSSVAVGGAVSLTFTITNPSGNPGAISASNIVDNFPANLVVANPPGTPVTTNCPGIAALTNAAGVAYASGQTSLRIQNASIAIGTPCVVTISVTPSVAGNFLNTVEVVSSSASVSGVFPVSIAGTSNTATLSAGKVGIAKAFSPSTINSGDTSTLTFTLTNGSAAAVSGINFTDLLTSLPTRQIVLTSGTVGGTCTGVASNAAVNGTSFIVTAGNVPASSSCTITLQVTSTVVGNHPNQTTGVSHATDGVAGAASNIATLTVMPPPTLVKSFLPAQVGQGLRSTLSLTVTNINNFPITNVAVTDTFPSGLLVATPLLTSNSCGGVVSRAASVLALAAGDSGFQLSGGSVATNSSCVIAVSVTAATSGAYVNTIAAGALTSSSGSNPSPATATLNVLQPLAAVKFFTPTAIVLNGTSVLTVRLTNPNAVAVTGVAFTDTYPANLLNTATPAGATSCPGGAVTATAGGGSLALSGATVPANNFCDITVNVTSNLAGVRTNPAITITTANAGTSASNPADLSVGVPSITKTFSPNPIAPGGVSTISFVITNPNGVAMNNVGFIDNFPATMTLANAASAAQCGGTLYNQAGVTPPPAASTGVRLGNAAGVGGGSIAANSSCTIQVAVTTPTAGVRINTTSAVTAGALVGDTATDTLTTFSPPTVTKSFTPNVAGVNVPVVLTIRIDNSNAFPMTGAAFTDTYPTNLVNTSSPSGTTTCSGGLVTASNGGASVALSGAVIPASGFCLVTVNVAGSTAGAFVNNVPAGDVTTTNAGNNAVASNNATLTVLAPPTVAKSFIGPSYLPSLAGTTMPLNTPTVMRITLTNPTSGAAITGVDFNDNYPSGLVNSAVPNATITGAGCTGTVTAAAAGASLALNNMTIPAGGTCTINVNVQSAVSAFYTNSTGVVTTTNAGNAAAASATIYAMAPLLVTKNFSPAYVPNGTATSGMTVSLVNPNPYPVTNGLIVDNYAAAGLGGADIDNVTPPVPSFTGAGCTGTLAATAGVAVSAMDLRNATVPANTTCTVNVAVVIAAIGDKTNCTGNITTANAGTTTSVCATINRDVTATGVPPSITKSFTPSSIAVNAVSTLSFTVTNVNAVGNNITATTFTDVLPTGLLVATPAVVTNTCGGTWNATSGSSILNLTGATVISASSCVVSVQVTGNTSGIYNNVSGAVSGNTGTGNQATATLTILDPPDITKAFTPAAIIQGGVSTISFVVTNNNSSIVSNLAFTDTLTGMTIVNPPVPVVTGAGCTGYTVTAPSGGSLISVSGGNVPARAGVVPGTCTITVQVTSAVAGSWPNATSQTTSSAGTGSGSNSATLTVNAVTSTVSGYVFIDANGNGTRNLGEDWASGVLVYVNIVSGGAVVQSQAVNPGNGFFNFPSVPYGNFTILVTNSPSNAGAVVPGGFSATQPTGAAWNLIINGSLIPLQEFGFTGPALSQVSGRVFRDTGFGSASPGTLANNGVLDAGEGGSSPGLSGVAVAVTDCAATTFATVSTDGGGNYTLRFPSTATTVCIVETNLAGYLSTGASQDLVVIPAGTCAAPPGGGAFEYQRSADRICFSKTGGSNITYTGLNFGDVPVNTWVADQAQQVTPGNFVNYPHVFTYESGGSVTFGSAVVATNPNIAGWSEVLYRDTDCDGRLDGGEPVISAPVVVTATAPPDNKVCVIVRQFSPPSAPFGAQRVVRVDATFTYTNAAPALTASYSRNDTTTVQDKAASGLRLIKEVCNETTLTCTDASIDGGNGNYSTSNAARSGDILRYRIIYTNTSSGPVNNVVINDTTPPFTSLQVAPPTCPVLPAGVTCSPAPTPAAVCAPGVSCPVRWTLSGTLQPGAQGVVLFKVQVQ